MMIKYRVSDKGYIQLAIRSGLYKKIIVTECKDGEITFNPITEEMTINAVMDMSERQKLETVGYYAKIVLVSGFEKELYWTKEQMQKHAETYSSGYRNDLKKGWNSTFWSKNFDDMAKKTLIRQIISKWGVMSVDMQTAYERDMSVEDANGNPNYIDNKPDEAPEVPEVFGEVIDVESKVVEEADEVFG
jgi:recombination protein RecT